MKHTESEDGHWPLRTVQDKNAFTARNWTTNFTSFFAYLEWIYFEEIQDLKLK